MSSVIGWISLAIIYGTIIAIASLGETITEKAGHLNLGVPGIMYISGITSVLVAIFLEQNNMPKFLLVIVPFVAALAVGGLFGLIYSIFCVTFKCNQNVMGLALSAFGVGFGKFISLLSTSKIVKVADTAALYKAGIPFLKDIPYVGQAIFSHGFTVYLTIALLIVCAILFAKTRIGLNLKAVGESAAAADSAGINVSRYKYLATIIGCALCGMGGLIYVMDFAGGYWVTNNNIEAIGWLAVALVSFATWKPIHLLWGAPLFGLLFWAYSYLPSLLNITAFQGMTEILEMLPYIATIILLIINSFRKKRENQPPNSLGVSYFREDR